MAPPEVARAASPACATAVDRSGNVLATISGVQIAGQDLVVKAVLLGSMQTTIVMKPAELWKLLTLPGAPVILRMPRLLYLGWRDARRGGEAGRCA